MNDKPKFKVGDLVTFKKQYRWSADQEIIPFFVTNVKYRNSFSSGTPHTSVRAYTPNGSFIDLNGDHIKKI